MNAAQRLVRLYPDSFRERWGPALETEVAATGWRSWPNLAVNIADMWLHPAIWPADSRAQRHHRAATMAITTTAAWWFLTHVATEVDSSLSTAVGRAWPMTACTFLMLFGLVLVAPRPRLTPQAAAAVLRRVVSGFTAPVVLGAVVVVGVHAGVYNAAPTLLRPALLACWWTALALGAIQCCRFVAGLGTRTVVPPRPGRLRLGLLTLATAGTLSGPILLKASVSGGHLDLLSAVSGTGLLVLTSAFLGTLRDIRDLPAAG